MKLVNLSKRLSQVKNLGEIIGPEEYNILENAFMLLNGQFPLTESDKAAYSTKSTQTQSQLINLRSRVGYIFRMTVIEKEAYWGQLIDNKEFDGFGKSERWPVALSLDSKYRDLSELVDSYDELKETLDNLLWSIKIAFQKL